MSYLYETISLVTLQGLRRVFGRLFRSNPFFGLVLMTITLLVIVVGVGVGCKRQQMQVTEATRERVVNYKNRMPMYVDLSDSPVLKLVNKPGEALLKGYNDLGAIMPGYELGHGEQVLWFVDWQVPAAIEAAFQRTVGAAYVLKADGKGQFTKTSSVGMWIPLLKGVEVGSYLTEGKPQPITILTTSATGSGEGVAAATATPVPKVKITIMDASTTWEVWTAAQSAPPVKLRGLKPPLNGVKNYISINSDADIWVQFFYHDTHGALQPYSSPNQIGRHLRHFIKGAVDQDKTKDVEVKCFFM